MNSSTQDAEHLRLLSIFHYVVGGILALFACIPIIHVLIGLAFIVAPGAFNQGANGPPFPTQVFGLLFLFLGGVAILFGWLLAGLMLYAGRCLAHRKHHTFCVVVAGLSCLFMPFGTVLGVFTLIVLLRTGVKEMFT